jgi:hypothetical protein
MSHRIIRSLFEARLSTWAKARTPVLRIAYQNVSFTPASNETYLRAFIIPAGTDSNDLAGAHRLFTGLFQVTIVTPSGVGTGAGETLADQIAALYPLNDALNKDAITVLVITPVEPGPEQQDDTTCELPVSFQYRCDTSS